MSFQSTEGFTVSLSASKERSSQDKWTLGSSGPLNQTLRGGHLLQDQKKQISGVQRVSSILFFFFFKLVAK